MKLVSDMKNSNSSYKWFYKSNTHISWYLELNIPGKILIIIMRAGTNHTRLNGHIHKLKILTSPDCEFKNAPQYVFTYLRTVLIIIKIDKL